MRKFLRHFFIPHESNNHRSRVLHHDSLLLVITFLISLFIVIQGAHRQYPAVLGDSTTSITVADLLKYTNLQRAANGLPPLTLNPDLTHAAQMKASDMFAKNYWAHVSPDGTTPWVWIHDSGYNYLYAGENLARGFNTSSDVVTAWMNSPEHRENMLSPHYTDIGFAVESGTLTGTETTLVVQEFGSPYNPDEPVTVTVDTPTPVPANVIAAGAQPTASGSPKVVGTVKIGEPTAMAGQSAQPQPPLIDASVLERNISFALLAFFLVILGIDAIIVERKQIVRVFSHNVDHMLFLLFILLVGILIGRGIVL